MIRTLDPIQWYEGMLLSPHHFQKADQQKSDEMQFHFNHADPFHWGISHIEVDTTLLMTGFLRIEKLEAIMPDGCIVSLAQPHLELDLTPHAEALSAKPHFVFLCLPPYRPGYGNAFSGNDMPRYKSYEEGQVIDENTGENEIQIPRLQPNLRLELSEKPPVGYVVLPLMKMKFQANAYVTDEYIPPLLMIRETDTLFQNCVSQAKRIRKKIAFLVERMRANSRGLLSAESEAAVKMLSEALLPLEAMLEHAATPRQLYLSLVRAAATLAGIDPNQVPPKFFGYNHLDLSKSYTDVMRFISAMIDRIQEGYSVIPFALQQNAFTLMLTDEAMNKTIVLGARAPIHMSEKALAEWVSNAIIASESHVETARDKRVRGAERKIMEQIESLQLLPAKGMVLFEVNGHSEFVVRDQPLYILNTSDTEDERPVEVVLYLPKSTTKEKS